VYKGKRKVWGVRVDENLLKKAKPILRAKFGSDCRGVEAWLAGLVATTAGSYKVGVNPSNTVEIGELNIVRAIRPRRKMVIDPEDVKVTVTCGFANCDEVAIGSGVWRKKQTVPLCTPHYAEACIACMQ